MRAEIGDRPTRDVGEAYVKGDLVAHAGLQRREQWRFDVFTITRDRVRAVNRVNERAHVAIAAVGSLVAKPIIRDADRSECGTGIQIIWRGNGRVEPWRGIAHLAEEIEIGRASCRERV